VAAREGGGEALTGEGAGQVLSCEIKLDGAPTPLMEAEGEIGDGVNREPSPGPAQSKTLRMRRSSSHGNREIPQVPAVGGAAGRSGKATSRTPDMYAWGKSDGCVVPEKPSNKGGVSTRPAEEVEGRQPTKGNMGQAAAPRTQRRECASIGLARVREAARRDRRARFTALLHHVSRDQLRSSYYALRRAAAPGVDGVTWAAYEVGLEDRLTALHASVCAGSYRAQPSKRAYIAKEDGRRRPLGIAALEDKVVQHAVGVVLTQIYEVDFKGFSYGFRPGRGQHDALDALWVGLMRKKVSWVVDADFQSFFDTIDHDWLLRFIEHRIADPRILRLIRKWLKAGVVEDGTWSEADVGTPQGAVISPLLANVYLHYVYDLWVERWRKTRARGDVIVVRYADDTVVGFQRRADAEQFLSDLRERVARFGLALHPQKTRVIEFGRFAASDRKRRGAGKPESFDFLGFTHFCGTTRRTRKFYIQRRTVARRLRAKLREVKATLMRRRHDPVGATGSWLGAVVRGYFRYHAIPGNWARLAAFRRECLRLWLRALRRRGQRRRITWQRIAALADLWIPTPTILHPYPTVRFDAKHPR
jgi:group II intron reverse transcriptase/maturase